MKATPCELEYRIGYQINLAFEQVCDRVRPTGRNEKLGWHHCLHSAVRLSEDIVFNDGDDDDDD